MSDQSSQPDYPSHPGAGVSDGGAAPPPSQGPAATTPVRPGTISAAVKLMWAGAALEVVVDVLGYATGVYVADATPVRAPGGFAGVLVGAVVNFGLWSWMAWRNGQGRSWARIVATILGGIGIIRALSGFFVIGAFGGGVVGLVGGLILAVLAVTILVLLWTKESTDFYKAQSDVKR